MSDRSIGVAVLGASLAVGAFWGSSAQAATYLVGPSRDYRQIAELPRLQPGDIVELDGDATYSADIVLDDAGTAAAPITLRGVRVNGRRPIISGGTTGLEFRASNWIMEGLDITGSSSRCVFHHADNITIRDTVVHDCPEFGIIGADQDSGSLTLQYVEVYGCGDSDRRHQIYMATDERAFPGSVFRMEHSYVHDGNGGNNVKSRAERNEIYYNWIEGAGFHELELVGPDGETEDLAREDSDVACNVIRKTGANADYYAARIGGDGTGQTWGRYRFVNNTFILPATGYRAVFRLFDGLECLEVHNNTFVREGSTDGVRLFSDSNVSWASGQMLVGSSNWFASGSTDIPSALTSTVLGSNPGFVSFADFDLRPREGSPLIDVGDDAPMSEPGFEFPRPLSTCAYVPPFRTVQAPGTATPRPSVGRIDIGAFEFGSGPPVDPDPGTDPGADPGADPGTGPDSNPGSRSGDLTGGCSIGNAHAPNAPPAGGVLLLLVAVLGAVLSATVPGSRR